MEYLASVAKKDHTKCVLVSLRGVSAKDLIWCLDGFMIAGQVVIKQNYIAGIDD